MAAGRLVARKTLFKSAAAVAVAAIAVAVVPSLSTGEQLKWTLWLSFGVVALSLSFIWGTAGIFSFGQNAIFGLGAYGYAIASLNLVPLTGETGSALLLAGLVGAIFAAALGYVLFYGRVGDVYLSVSTLAITLLLYTVLSSTAGPDYRIGNALLGGFNGMPGLPPLTIWLPVAGTVALDFAGLMMFAIILSALLYISVLMVCESRVGRILRGIRENETRMELLGYDTRFWKWLAFSIGGLIAGLGGAVFAAWGTFTNPSLFSLSQAAMVIIWVMVGGRGSLVGAFVGVALVQWVTDAADEIVSQQTPLVLGIALILTILILPNGLVPSLSRIAAGVFRSARGASLDDPRAPEAAAWVPDDTAEDRQQRDAGTLTIRDVSKNFGGLQALRSVDLDFGRAPVHAIIGPNGAGKSTLFNVLTGRVRADRGRVTLDGNDVTHLHSFQRARKGLGIKMQVPAIFQDITVEDSIALALRTVPRGDHADRVDRVLRLAGLAAKRNMLGSSISHGEQQWLEIAMVVAQAPSVILLDEPVAGMSLDEKRKTLQLINRLAADRTIIVIEHDMAFVRALNAPVVMLHQGSVFRTGAFEALSADTEVMDVYLGRPSRAEGR